MKKILIVVSAAVLVAAAGCYKPADPRITLREGVRSDTLESNIVTRPVAHAFSALIGEGIEVENAFTRKTASGLLELHVNGLNKSYNTRRFEYKVEWLDEGGVAIPTKTSVWTRVSTTGKAPFSFQAVAPRENAVDFRLDTRKWE